MPAPRFVPPEYVLGAEPDSCSMPGPSMIRVRGVEEESSAMTPENVVVLLTFSPVVEVSVTGPVKVRSPLSLNVCVPAMLTALLSVCGLPKLPNVPPRRKSVPVPTGPVPLPLSEPMVRVPP